MTEKQQALEAKLADQEQSRRRENDGIRAAEREQNNLRQAQNDLRLHSQAFAAFKKLTNPDEIEAHMQTFEEVADMNKIPRDRWVTLLLPLLDDVSIAARNAMPEETRRDYQAVKEVLLNLHGRHRGHFRKKWAGETFDVDKCKSYLQLHTHLKQTLTAWNKQEEDTDWMIREQFYRIAQPDVSRYVALQDPDSAMKAFQLADVYKSQNPHLHWLKRQEKASKAPWPRRKPAEELGQKDRYPRKPENKPDYNQTDRRSTPKSGDSRPRQCWSCGEAGHLQMDCPKRKECNMAEKDNRRPLNTFPGTIFGHAVQRILVDTGCDQSQVAPQWMPAAEPICGNVQIQAMLTQHSGDLRKVAIRLNGRSVQPLVMVNPVMKYDAVIGMDVEGIAALLEGVQDG